MKGICGSRQSKEASRGVSPALPELKIRQNFRRMENGLPSPETTTVRQTCMSFRLKEENQPESPINLGVRRWFAGRPTEKESSIGHWSKTTSAAIQISIL